MHQCGSEKCVHFDVYIVHVLIIVTHVILSLTWLILGYILCLTYTYALHVTPLNATYLFMNLSSIFLSETSGIWSDTDVGPS